VWGTAAGLPARSIGVHPLGVSIRSSNRPNSRSWTQRSDRPRTHVQSGDREHKGHCRLRVHFSCGMALDSVLASVGRLVCVLYVVLMVAVGMKLLLMASDRQE